MILSLYSSKVSFKEINASAIKSNLSLLSTIKQIVLIGIFFNVLYCTSKIGIKSSITLNPGKSNIIL